MKLIICGDHLFTQLGVVFAIIDAYVERYGMPDEVVSGDAPGVDTLGALWATEKCPVKHFPADWHRFHKAAGHQRNIEMAHYGTHCLALACRRSRGTRDMIREAHRMGLPTVVVELDSLAYLDNGERGTRWLEFLTEV